MPRVLRERPSRLPELQAGSSVLSLFRYASRVGAVYRFNLIITTALPALGEAVLFLPDEPASVLGAVLDPKAFELPSSVRIPA